MPPQRPALPPTVVLVGRPNVGKSTLFNRLVGARRAIVTAVPGTTRDVVAQPAEWGGVSFRLVDSGGLFGASDDPLQELVMERGLAALRGADLVLFVVDAREGLVQADEAVALEIRKAGRPVVMAANKVDDRRAHGRAVEFYQLAFEPIVEISAEHGDGVGDLLDAVVSRLAPEGPPEAGRADPGGETGDESLVETGVAIVGRPNVGKSSLVNRLLRDERVMVSDQPGTTRDAVDELLKWHSRRFRIVDTAGIRRPGRVGRSGRVEGVSVVVARREIERADIAVLVVDATEGATDQDAAIAGEADRAGCGIIIAVNKWDLRKEPGVDVAKAFDDALRRQLKFLDYAPVLHVSAVTGERTPKLLEAIDRVAEARRQRVPTGQVNRLVEAVTREHPPASPGRTRVRVLYAAQTAVAPPTFVLFTNVATRLHFSYERFLINRLREAFGFVGTPIRIQVRRRRH